ncbi:aspartate aminotransferase family protein, partial [uncultured Alistipes sp.]
DPLRLDAPQREGCGRDIAAEIRRLTMNTILRKQFLAHVGQTSPSPMLVEVERAEGTFFYTPEGKRYYDLVAGVSVSNVGHCNPAVVRAVQEQAARYMHVMVYGELVERPQVRYAAKVASLLPQPIDSLYFVNSGAEAVEGALKLAKRFSGRTELVGMRRAYHGSTHGAMSMMGTPEGEQWKAAFRPLLPDVQSIEFNDFAALERITRRTACVLAEPVQGEAGVRPPAAGYLEALRRRCDEVGALLIFDEIQTGMGRTGALFAMQRYGVTPDIVCLAKAFGGGMPLGAFAAPKRIMDALQTAPVLGHITTFGGHPVCCAAGLAALDYLLEHDVVAQVERKGALYEELLRDHPAVREIRRSGLLLAVELGDSARLYRMMELFAEAGIMSDWFLYCDTAFRISPPLTISEEEVRDSARLIRECLDRL